MAFPRRTFFKLSAASLLAGVSACRPGTPTLDCPVFVDAGLLRGHQLFEPGAWRPPTGVEHRDVLVVGAGIAGLSAAAALKDRDLVVCEVGDVAGGSSSAGRTSSGIPFAQGAHYDLAYPAEYGAEALAFLEDLRLISFDNRRGLWDFTDTQYLINPATESRTWTRRGLRPDPIPQNDSGRRFHRAVADFAGKMPMPTRLIDPAYHAYDRISFADWLQTMNLIGDPVFRAGIDYQLTDDYGAGADVVSALAGIHYYQCRPYYSQEIAHFSPPQGNAYFVDKLLAQLPAETVRTRHLVRAVTDDGDGFRVDVLDFEEKQQRTFRVNGVVYAGQKHALKYVYPAGLPHFAKNRYAPWLTVSFELERRRGELFWQNEVIGHDETFPGNGFLGFVNGAAQHGAGASPVLTGYFCLPEARRDQLLSVRDNPMPWLTSALAGMNKALNTSLKVKEAHLKLHGHAMPIPTPGYLFHDANAHTGRQRLVYAGVDNGRLPLFFEALDSGLLAGRELNRRLHL